MKNMVISYKSYEDITEDYLGVPLHTTVEVLEVIDNDGLNFEVKECRKELQVDFRRMKSTTLDIDFSLVYTHQKLNSKVHKSNTFYFINRMAIIRYLIFFWSDLVQFLTVNLGASFSQGY